MNLKGVKYLEYVGESNVEFTHGMVYRLSAIESESSIIVINNLKIEAFVEGDGIRFFKASNENQARESLNKSIERPPVQGNKQSKLNIKMDDNSFDINVSLNESDYPYWAAYVTINGQGVIAHQNENIESGLSEKIKEFAPIVIKIPKKQTPTEVLLNLYKEGKISIEQAEYELKNVLKK